MFKSFADLKRFLASEGATVTMTRHDWSRGDKRSQFIGNPRGIEKVQTNAVRFEGGSWWYFPPARAVRFTADGFETCLKQDGSFKEVMAYSCAIRSAEAAAADPAQA